MNGEAILAVACLVVGGVAGYIAATKVTVASVETELKAIEAKGSAEGKAIVADAAAVVAKIRAKLAAIKI